MFQGSNNLKRLLQNQNRDTQVKKHFSDTLVEASGMGQRGWVVTVKRGTLLWVPDATQ